MLFDELDIRSIEFINMSSFDSFEDEHSYKFDFKTDKYIYKEITHYIAVPIGTDPKNWTNNVREGEIKNILKQMSEDLEYLEYDITICFNDGSTLIFTYDDGSWVFNKTLDETKAKNIVNKLGKQLFLIGFTKLKKDSISYEHCKTKNCYKHYKTKGEHIIYKKTKE